MLTYIKKANLVLILILTISLYLTSNVKAAPENSDLYRASFSKKSPANLSTGLDPSKVKLEWSSISDIFQYRYCYYSYDITNNVCDIEDKSTWKSNETSTSVQLPTLVAGKTYYWQVSAKLEDNSFVYADGSLTSKWSFTTSTGIVGAGTYDNTHANWAYTGKWVASTATGPYNGTYKESRDIPDYATFAFTGARLRLYYTQGPGRGVMNIYIDNSTTPIALNQSGPLTWQKWWMSDPLTSGTHTIKLVYVSGGYVNIDAIQIFAQADLTAPAQITLSAATGTNAGTVKLNWTAVGDDLNTGTASSYLVRYSTSAISDENWANATAITKGVPTPKTAGLEESMTVAGLTPGQTYYFAIRAEDEQSNTGALSNSPLATASQPPPAEIGIHDDSHINWIYTGTFTTFASSGAYNGATQYTTTMGDSAEFTFNGSQISILYTGYTNRGNVDVFLDGNPTRIGTFNEYTASTVYQKKWTSGDLGAGPHTVKLVHAGAAGKTINIDAIEVRNYEAPGTGTYDDTHEGWTYTGAFTTFASSGAYNGGIRYTTTIGDSAEFTFNGSQISILYTGYTNRGNVDVFLDDNPTRIGTFNEYTASTVYQKKWTSGDLGAGTHTIKLVHAGASDKMVNIDAIQVGVYVPPVVPGAGTYDDTHEGWTYTGAFTTFASSEAHNGGIRYTTTMGDSAEFTFTGSQISILYTGNTNRGNVDVFLDDNPTRIGTFNEYTATVAFRQEWTSENLGTGTHTVRLVHAGPSGTTINVDAIEVLP